VEDVLDALAPALRSRSRGRPRRVRGERLTPTERRVLDALGGEATHVDDVVGRSGAAAGDVLETLLALELRRLVDQRPGMRFVRRGAA
jgi:predicted Rossmann fold nucleotide-binding protein DprA/Smf involved in DNA uptake